MAMKGSSPESRRYPYLLDTYCGRKILTKTNDHHVSTQECVAKLNPLIPRLAIEPGHLRPPDLIEK